ncbi:MAG: hypothetical protein QM610_00195 [Chitinophagaceae bacterium]
MQQPQNKQRNKCQLLTLLFLAIAVVYIRQVYVASQIVTDNRTGKIVFKSVVAGIALFVSWYYFREARKAAGKE